MERYIGLDAHAASCTLAVISQAGRRLKDFPIETNGQALVEAIRMIPGRKHRTDPGDGPRHRADPRGPARADRGHPASFPHQATVLELLRARDCDPLELRLGADGRRRMDPGPGPADAGIVPTVQPRAEGHLQGRRDAGHHTTEQRSALPSLRTDARRRDEAESRQAHACAHHRSDGLADVEGRGGVQAGSTPTSHGVRPQRVGDFSVWKSHEEGVAARCGRAMGSEVSIHVLPGPGTSSWRPYG